MTDNPLCGTKKGLLFSQKYCIFVNYLMCYFERQDMKTLYVSYLPSGANSRTARLARHFLTAIEEQDTEHLDLLNNPPPYFDLKSLDAYYKKHYMNEVIDPEQEAAMADFYRYCNQLKEADVLVMAYPMYNFGMPGLVKLYFDAVILKGESFDMGITGRSKGLLTGKKALTIYTAGAKYDQERVSIEYPYWDALGMSARIMFNFMGFEEVEVIAASTGSSENLTHEFSQAIENLDQIADKWYS